MSGSSPHSSDHYSYRVYADPATARRFDKRRFGGPIGELVAGTQARVLTNMIGRVNERTILDVGTGTGRAALHLAHGGARVIGVDASSEMLDVARQRAASRSLNVKFVVGDAHDLDFRDRSFDVAVALRLLMHAPAWRRCLAELCRVADRLVVFDYPSARSLAAVESVARRLASRAGVQTEPYQVFSPSTIAAELAKSNFRVRSIHRQFVLPIAFHKAIGSRRLTVFTEDILDRVGLLKLFGSPVTLVAERCAPS